MNLSKIRVGRRVIFPETHWLTRLTYGVRGRVLEIDQEHGLVRVQHPQARKELAGWYWPYELRRITS